MLNLKSKRIIIPAAAVIIGGSTVFGTVLVNAQTTSNTPYSGLVQAIAQKFNLNQADVQSVFSQYRSQQQANMQQRMQQNLKTKLDQEVTAGKITSDQETAILNELTTLRNKYNPSSFKGMTVSQIKQQMQNEQSDLKSWAQSQNIDLSLIPRFGGFGRAWGRRGMHSPNPSANPSATPSPSSSTS